MQIYGPFRVSATTSTGSVQSAAGVDRAGATGETSRSQSAQHSPVDQLDLSQAASDASRIDSSVVAGEGIRFERVAELRRQIAAGDYDSPERMDAALDRFLDQLG
ncbi:MAG: flagellar biosynthesis anti-sigma factor FlgM [Planctomycetota bacterium]